MKDGVVCKSAQLEAGELEKIRALSIRPLKEEEIYVFSLLLCDNEIDRDGERFSIKALHDLAALFIGRTGILDHDPKAANQTARIFSTKVEQQVEKRTSAGEVYTCLKARAYMVRSARNEDIILEIDSGIKKEISIGCRIDKVTCSICGADLRRGSCGHEVFQRYPTPKGERVCHRILSEPGDAYEWSFVAVPAQRMAGVTKAFGRKEEGERMDILKKVKQGEEIVWDERTRKALLDSIETLEQEAAAGRSYLEQLRREVVRLSFAVQPDIDGAIVRSVADKMTAEELIAYRKSYEKRAGVFSPAKPQLMPEGAEKDSRMDNHPFQI